MTHPLSFDPLQAILCQHTAGLSDFRKPSPNTRYQIQDAVLGAFGVFFTQSPSFLEYQRRLNQTHGHDNAQTLFGVEPIPCDNQVCNLLDPIAPSYFNPVFFEVFEPLERQPLLEPLCVLDHQLLVSLDGTQFRNGDGTTFILNQSGSAAQLGAIILEAGSAMPEFSAQNLLHRCDTARATCVMMPI